jgi:5,6-dimethylbenzimidazole synthase
MSDNNCPFSEQELNGLYRAIYERRDVRSQFLPDAIPATKASTTAA